jgi:hypothetical protein
VAARRDYDRGVELSFSAPKLPLTLRVCRTLLWTQAAITVLGGVFVVLTAALFGASNSIPFHDGTLSGGAAAALGIVYIAAGLALTWLGIALGQRASWTLAGIAGMQAFLAVLDLYRSFDASPSTLLNIALYIAVLALLFAPDTRRALEGTPAP